MANTHGTLTELFTAIANAIRAKTGSSAKIVADDFPSAIAGISTGTGTATPKLQTKTVTPKASVQTVSPDSGYDGLSTVTVSGDSDLVAGNIKSGVNIFGVTGSYTGSNTSGGGISVKTGAVTVDASTESVTFETGLSSVVGVVAIKSDYNSDSNTYGWHEHSSISGTQYHSKGTLSNSYFTTIPKVTITGGTVTLKQYSSSYPITAGTIHWEVYGT